MNLILSFLLVAAPPDITVLRWLSPDSSKPTTFQEWQKGLSVNAGWQVRQLRTVYDGFDRRVDILVQDSLVSALTPFLDTMFTDIQNEGYDVGLYAITGTSCESLRAFLQREYEQANLISAILIGNLPVAWFQMIDDWNNNHQRDPDEGYEEFPCDLYLMDLDGIWLDTLVRLDTLDSLVFGSDGIYDVHYGDFEPEIGISRIYTSTISHQISLIQQYLSRCHSYRTGNLQVSDRALTYIDDDWIPWAWEWDSCVGYLYPERVFISEPEQTRILDYRPRIDTAVYQWLQLCAHSWPGGHAMKFAQGDSWDWFYATWIPGINPEICFYNLFACSNVRFIESGYCGGRYVFQTTSGLGAIGSTKTGSMLDFQSFYLPLSNGMPLALAFQQWFAGQAQNGFDPWERSWFYGMCLIGDGMLKPRFSVPITEAPFPVLPRFTSSVLLRNRVVSVNRPATVIDPTGRIICRLLPGENRLDRLTSGVYFLRIEGNLRVVPIRLIH